MDIDEGYEICVEPVPQQMFSDTSCLVAIVLAGSILTVDDLMAQLIVMAAVVTALVLGHQEESWRWRS